MDKIDKNYLRLQFWLKIHEKKASEFQSFFEEIMQKAFPDFQKIRPYGKKGDQGNDGYRANVGEYYQIYSPQDPSEKEAAAAKKLKEDFEKLKRAWDQISKIKTFYFIYNDKGIGVSIEIEKALAELKNANPNIDFKKLLPRELEDIFFRLKPDQILALGFDIDSTNARRVAQESLVKLEKDLDRENGRFVLKSLENLKDIIVSLKDELLQADYDILECRALVQFEEVREARRKYEGLCKRYPKDPRPFLYLAHIYLDYEDPEKNEALLKQAEAIDRIYWLLTIEKFIRQYRLGNQIPLDDIDENLFPADPRVKATFYRLYALFLQRGGDEARADSFIERAIYLNPDKLANYFGKLSILEHRMVSGARDKDEFQKKAVEFLSEIDAVQKKANEWGQLAARSQLIINVIKFDVSLLQENPIEMESLAKDSFALLLQCYFDQSIDNTITGMLRVIHLPLRDFDRLLQYLKEAEKPISDGLAKILVIQFNLSQTLFTHGKNFFQAINQKQLVDFIDKLEKKKYEEVWDFLKGDMEFAVSMANTAKDFPDLRKKIIENLPDDGKFEKDKLLLLLNYDQKNFDEAFKLLQGFDFSNLGYFESTPILEIFKKKKAWDLMIKVLEKLLKNEKDLRAQLQLALDLFTANLMLERFPESIRIGEGLLSDSSKMALLDDKDRERLLANTLIARMQHGNYSEAKKLLEMHSSFSKSFDFKSRIEAEIYLKNREADKAIASIVEGIKVLKTPTPEQYGILFLTFSVIGNLIGFRSTSEDTVKPERFIKFQGQERWYFVGNTDELDATKVPSTDKKYKKFLGKPLGDKVIFDDKYRSIPAEYSIEVILPIEKYILWQSTHHAQQLSLEQRWDVMETVEVPTTALGIDTRYIIARLEGEKHKRGEFFDLFCRENLPLAFLAVVEGGLANAIGRITAENKGFVRFSSGDLGEINQQKEVAKKVISGERFYIDGTSALVLSEPGFFEQVYRYLPNMMVPQSVITLMLTLREKFTYTPGQVGHLGYSRGKISFSSIDETTRSMIEKNFETAIKYLESKPLNIVAISAANKTDLVTEQKVPAGLCDACILAQRDDAIVLTEDFLYLKANEIETGKKAPEYCSAFSLVRVLYEQKNISFDKYLEFFGYLSSYRFRFLPLTTEDIEKGVFGDGIIKVIRPEKIRQFNFPLTLSKEYGVPFDVAFRVVVPFLTNVFFDDAILPEITERIFFEILFNFPTDKDKRFLATMFLKVVVQNVNNVRKGVIRGARIQEKVDLISQLIPIFNAGDSTLIK